MRFGLFATALLAGAVSFTVRADAQMSPVWETCTGLPNVDWDQQIKSCTSLIGLTTETSQNHAVAYIRRGIAYLNKGDLDRAIADYTVAVEVDSNSAQAYFDRGNIYLSKGDYDKAIADFTSAIQLNTSFAAAYRSRGLAYLYSAESSKAFADISKAHLLDRKDAYSAIWLDIAGQSTNAKSYLSQATSDIDMKAWPAPVIRMFIGQMTPDAVLAEANGAAPPHKNAQVCEANFYAGEWALRTGTKDEATKLFRVAAGICPKDFLESSAANAELRRVSAAK